jgi:threonine dehydrogenase-like Zn-dependent dehydrogenase
MKAISWFGKEDVRYVAVENPVILYPGDAIIKVSLAAICGSDLHLYDGAMLTMEKGDILGHETMGEVVETGSAVTTLKKGDRVVIPFPIACGTCFFCKKGLYSCCDNSNPNAKEAAKLMGESPAGIYGYSHLLGGYPGGQAQYLRVPYADVNHLKVPAHLSDEQVLFLSDVFPTGYMVRELRHRKG